MSKRKRLVGVVVLVSLGALGLTVWLHWPRTAINERSAGKLKNWIAIDMTLAEVEAFLGGPARDESTGPLVVDDTAPGPLPAHDLTEFLVRRPEHPQRTRRVWLSNRRVIVVYFHDNSRACACEVLPVRLVNEGPLDLLDRWLVNLGHWFASELQKSAPQDIQDPPEVGIGTPGRHGHQATRPDISSARVAS
jgi:hypothetical protein